MNNSPNPTGNQPNPVAPQNPMNTQWPQPKPPMDPAKKKRLITIILLIFGGLAIAIVAIILFVIMSKIDYSASYQSAKDLKSVIYSLGSSDCTNITDRVDSTYTNDKTYNNYISTCLATIQDINKYSDELQNTDAVKKNKDIKTQFERYQEIKNIVVPTTDDFTAKTNLYSAWHGFTYNAEKLSASKASDADLQHTANFLINSGNEQLKTYGEGWLEKTLAYVHAYQAYNAASYSDPNRSQLRQTRDDLKNDRSTWITANRPNLSTLTSLDFSKSKQLTNEFSKLYDLIKEGYEENYDSGKNDDCFELFGEVICD